MDESEVGEGVRLWEKDCWQRQDVEIHGQCG